MRGMVRSQREMLDYVSSLDARTVKGLLAIVEKEPRTANTDRKLRGLISRLTELDPEAALMWIENVRSPNVKAVLTQDVFDVLSANNPNAFAALARVKGTPGAEDATAATLKNMTRKDPVTALMALRSLPAAQQAEQLYTTLFHEWAGQNPQAAAVAALDLPLSPARNQALSAIASTWATQDPTRAMAWIATLPPGAGQDGAVATALQAWGRQNPPAAAAYALNLPESEKRDFLLNTLTLTWAESDPTGLLDWASQFLSGKNYETATATALTQWGRTNPAAAAAYLGQNPKTPVGDQITSAIAYAWAGKDLPSALAWAKAIPVNSTINRTAALSAIVEAYGYQNNAQAAAFLQQNLTMDPDFGALAVKVAETWGATNPQSALAWAQSLPAGEAQHSAEAAVHRVMAGTSPPVTQP